MEFVSTILKPDKKVFRENRDNFLKLLGEKSDIKSGLLVLKGQYEVPVYDEDIEYSSIPESFFYYLFGVIDNDCYGIIDLSTKKSTLLIPKLDSFRAVWVKKRDIEEFKNDYDIDVIDYTTSFKDHISSSKIIYFNNGINPISGLQTLTPENDTEIMDVIKAYNIPVNKTTMFKYLCEARSIKSKSEIELLKNTAKVASGACKFVLSKVRPNASEMFLNNQFLTYCTYNGSINQPFNAIFASGNNASYLNYCNNDGVLNDKEMTLLNFGSYNNFYAANIAVTVPNNGKFSELQKNVYNIVLKAQDYVINNLKHGLKYDDLKLEVYNIIIKGLQNIKIIKDSYKPENTTNKLLAYYFIPNEILTSVGVSANDYSNFENNISKGIVLACQCGIYLNNYLLKKLKDNKELSQYINFDIVENYKSQLRGIKIGDMVVIGEKANEIISDIPRTTDQIEKYMSNNK